MRKLVFGGVRQCNQERLKPACSVTEVSYSLEILGIANYMCCTIKAANNKGTDQTVRMRRLICAFVVRKWHKTGFLMMWLIFFIMKSYQD